MPTARIEGSASSDAGGSLSSTGRRVASTRPAIPASAGTRRGRSSATTGSELISESMPSSSMSSSAAASASSTSRVRARISGPSLPRSRCVSAASATACRRPIVSAARSASARAASERTSRSRLSLLHQPVADVGEPGVEHELAVALDDPDHRLAAQLRPVGAVDRHAQLEMARAALAGGLQQVAAALDRTSPVPPAGMPSSWNGRPSASARERPSSRSAAALMSSTRPCASVEMKPSRALSTISRVRRSLERSARSWRALRSSRRAQRARAGARSAAR